MWGRAHEAKAEKGFKWSREIDHTQPAQDFPKNFRPRFPRGCLGFFHARLSPSKCELIPEIDHTRIYGSFYIGATIRAESKANPQGNLREISKMAAATLTGGRISADELYTLEEIQARLGLGTAALRTARRQGLTVRRIGRRGYLLGRDVMKFVEREGK
jgi:hypothetical protein